MFDRVAKYMQAWRESFLRDGTRPTKERPRPISIWDQLNRPPAIPPIYMNVPDDVRFAPDGWSVQEVGTRGFLYLPLLNLREEFENGDRYQRYAARMEKVFHSRFLVYPESHGPDPELEIALTLHKNSANYRRVFVTGADGVSLRKVYNEFTGSGGPLGSMGLKHGLPGTEVPGVLFPYAGRREGDYARQEFERYYSDRGPRGGAYDLYKRAAAALRLLDIDYARIQSEDEEELERLQNEFVDRHPHYEPAPYDRMAHRNNPYRRA